MSVIFTVIFYWSLIFTGKYRNHKCTALWIFPKATHPHTLGPDKKENITRTSDTCYSPLVSSLLFKMKLLYLLEFYHSLCLSFSCIKLYRYVEGKDSCSVYKKGYLLDTVLESSCSFPYLYLASFFVLLGLRPPGHYRILCQFKGVLQPIFNLNT